MATGQHIATRGLFLGAIAYGDKAQILKIWTRQHGLQSYMAHNPRSKRAAIRPAMMLPLTALNLVVSHRAEGKMGRIHEASTEPLWDQLHSDPVMQSACMFAAELFQKALREGESTEVFFDDVMHWLMDLDTNYHEVAMAPVYAALMVAHHVGFAIASETYRAGMVLDLREGQFIAPPALHSDIMEAEASAALVAWIQNRAVAPDKAQRQVILDGLLGLLQWHHPQLEHIQSLGVLRALY